MRDPKALVIEDDDFARQCLANALNTEGWAVLEFNRSLPPQQLSLRELDLVICDQSLLDSHDFQLLPNSGVSSHRPKVVLTTSEPTGNGAFYATSLGAFDYLTKPLDSKEVHRLCERLRHRFNTHSNFFEIETETESNEQSLNLTGRSKAFLEVIKQAGRVAGTTLPVLLTGESGTGKEVLATAIHQRSKSSCGPFIALNCGAIPAELIESELFGHTKGSFTGADRDRQGLWEEASGGTIFLDEITETTLSFQVKLLRAIQQGEVRRVGSNETRQVDVRVIAATNRDVEHEVAAGRFRQDLYYRLNAVSIKLPPLRKRKEDIPLLVEAFVQRVSTKSRVRFSGEVFEILNRYDWPGNVRELEHAILGSVAVCDGIVVVEDLPEPVRAFWESSTSPSNVESLSMETNEWPTLAVVEANYVFRALGHNNWNKQATATMLKIDRKTLDRMIKRYKLVQSKVAPYPVQERQAA